MLQQILEAVQRLPRAVLALARLGPLGQPLPYVPLHVVRQHANQQVRPHPRFPPVEDRAHRQLRLHGSTVNIVFAGRPATREKARRIPQFGLRGPSAPSAAFVPSSEYTAYVHHAGLARARAAIGLSRTPAAVSSDALSDGQSQMDTGVRTRWYGRLLP